MSPAVGLRLKLLGDFQARCAAGPVIGISAKKSRALLAYLALSAGRAHGRDKLADLLWSDRGDKQARDSLRQALAELRDALADIHPPPLVTDHDLVTVDAGTVEVDALLLEQAAREGTREGLERVEALYGGELLEGFQFPSTAFEEWILLERRHIRDLAADTLGRLMALRAAAGETDKANDTARRVLALDELREDAHRCLVRNELRRGNRSTALKQIERCESILKSASVTPERDTVRLFAEVRGSAEMLAEASVSAESDKVLGLPDKPSIAVLPFDNLSGASDQQDLVDGITEDIIAQLSRFHSLFVIARNSSFQYRGKTVDAKRIGRELGVRYVVEGSFRRTQDRVRISAQLIDASNNVHLWAEHYDCKPLDVFDAQDDLSQRVAATVAVRLEGHELALAKRKPPGSMQAYDFWLQGKKCLDLHSAEGFTEARRFFERAIEVDPGYARAYAGLAYVYNMAPFYSDWGGASVEQSHEKAFDFAQQAVTLDRIDHLPHLMLGWCQLWRRNYGEARREFELGLALNPNDADALAYRGFYQIYMGDPEAGVETAKNAIRLNPYCPDWYIAHLVCAQFMARQCENAIAAGEGLRDVWPEYSAWMAALFAHAGRLDEARLRAVAFVANVRRVWTGDPQAGPEEFVRWMMSWNPFRLQTDTDYFIAGLRKAGLIA